MKTKPHWNPLVIDRHTADSSSILCCVATTISQEYQLHCVAVEVVCVVSHGTRKANSGRSICVVVAFPVLQRVGDTNHVQTNM